MTEKGQPAETAPAAAEQPIYQHEADAFYHDPPLWVGNSPVDPAEQAPPDFDAFSQTAFRRKFDAGIEIKVSADGLFAFGFTGWQPGNYPARRSDGMLDFDGLAGATLARTLVMR